MPAKLGQRDRYASAAAVRTVANATMPRYKSCLAPRGSLQYRAWTTAAGFRLVYDRERKRGVDARRRRGVSTSGAATDRDVARRRRGPRRAAAEQKEARTRLQLHTCRRPSPYRRGATFGADRRRTRTPRRDRLKFGPARRRGSTLNHVGVADEPRASRGVAVDATSLLL